MAKTTRTKPAPLETATQTNKLNVPSIIRPKSAPVAAPAVTTGAGLLSKLTGIRKSVLGEPTSKKKTERPTLELPVETQSLFKDHILAAELSDHFNTHSENLKDELKRDLFPLYLKQMWAAKAQPANPSIKVMKTVNDPTGRAKEVPDLEGMFQVQERMKVQANDADELTLMLQEIGLTKANAEKLVTENIDFTPKTTVNFNVLLEGKYVEGKFVESSPEEKIIGHKALALLMGEKSEKLTDEELALLIDTAPNIVVKKGFLERVCGYIEVQGEGPEADQRGVQILTAVLTLLKPTLTAGRAKFGISDTLVEKNQRLLNGAKQIIGITDEE